MNKELKLLMKNITEGDKLPLRDIPIGSCFLWADQGKAVRIVESDETNRYLLLSNILSNGDVDQTLIELNHVCGFEKEYPIISEAQLAEGIRLNKENPPEPYIHPVLAGLNQAVGEYFRVMGEGIIPIGDMPLPQPRGYKRELKRAKLREEYANKMLKRQLVLYKHQLLYKRLVAYLKPIAKYTRAGYDFQV